MQKNHIKNQRTFAPRVRGGVAAAVSSATGVAVPEV